jgi:hypothetical protein
MRGLQDIRTQSGRVDQSSLPHKAYLKIAFLELEKFRRDAERRSALERVKNIEARFQEIEAEQGALLRSLTSRQAEPLPAAQAGRAESEACKSAERCFKLRY